MSSNTEVKERDDLFEGCHVERDLNYNFRFMLPNGGFRPMTLQEALLWEILAMLRLEKTDE